MHDDDSSSGAAYYAVVFTSQRNAQGEEEYEQTAGRMLELAADQPGFLGVDSARNPDGLGITVSYWESLEAIDNWRRHAEHTAARERGRREWYEWFRLRVCRIEREYGSE